jgi:hypothetical protein
MQTERRANETICRERAAKQNGRNKEFMADVPEISARRWRGRRVSWSI